MDLYKAIQDLVDEKKRLDAVIASLEAREAKKPAVQKRRGRKSMSAEERAAVSRRMAAWWAARRDAAGSEAPEGTNKEAADQTEYSHSMAASAGSTGASLNL